MGFEFYFGIIMLCLVVGFYFYKKLGSSIKFKVKGLSPEHINVLSENVHFYKELNDADKLEFEKKVHDFLSTIRITPIKTTVEPRDEIYIAAGAVIPVFRFKEWNYHLDEVLLYAESFNENFEFDQPDSLIQGLVGYGPYEGKMLLAQTSLRYGFENYTDKKNVAIHEFAHLIDKADGEIDGIPSLILDHNYSIPWLELMHEKIERIRSFKKEKSNINKYGGTNKAEFFAVASEYFFENPQLLKKKHPEVYAMLEKVFMGKM